MMDVITRILFVMILAVVIVLTATAIPTLIGHHLTGQSLIIHMMAGGSLVIAMPLFALLFLGRAISTYRSNRLQRFGYWLTVVAVTISIGSVLLCMLPLLSTEAMQTTMGIHGYAGFVAAAALVVLLIGSVRRRRM